MAEVFRWVTNTPLAGQILVLALALFVAAFCCAVILFIVAFVKDRPISMFGFRIPESRLVYEIGQIALPEHNKPRSLYASDAIYDGERFAEASYTFTKKFKKSPELVIGLVRIDAGAETGVVRLEVSVESVTPKGFTLRFKTWESNQLFSASVRWIAIEG